MNGFEFKQESMKNGVQHLNNKTTSLAVLLQCPTLLASSCYVQMYCSLGVTVYHFLLG